MKILFFIIPLLFSTTFLFNHDIEKSIYPEGFPSELAETYAKEYIRTIDNEALNTKLEKVFEPFFDEVNYVNAQYSEEAGYYYMAFGTQNGMASMELIKVSKNDMENGTFSFDLSKLSTKNPPQYCRMSYSTLPRACGIECKVQTTNCLGLVCGIAGLSGGCLSF